MDGRRIGRAAGSAADELGHDRARRVGADRVRSGAQCALAFALASVLVSPAPSPAAACSCSHSMRVYGDYLGRATIHQGEHLWVALEPISTTPLLDAPPDPIPRTSETPWAAIEVVEGRRRVPVRIARRIGRARVALEIVPDAALRPGARVSIVLVQAVPPGDRESAMVDAVLGITEPSAPRGPLRVQRETLATVHVDAESAPSLAWSDPVSSRWFPEEGSSCSDGMPLVEVQVGSPAADALFVVAGSPAPDALVVARADPSGVLLLDSAAASRRCRPARRCASRLSP